MIKRVKWAALAPAFILLAACAGKAPIAQSSDVTHAFDGVLPPPSASDMQAGTRPYLLGPFDKLKVDVFGVEDLEREIQIDASGRFSFPLIGEVQAAGRTPTEISREIESRLKGNFVRNPQVTVNLEETISQRVTVDGEVTRPGLYPVLGNMTLMRAVATAEGVEEYADLEDVVIFRTVNGQKYVALYSLEGIRRGNYPDPAIYANDVVIVGDSKSRRLFDNLLKVAPLITTPLILIARN